MNFELKVKNGTVDYLTRQNGVVVGGKTKVESAMWTLGQGKPERSREFPDYPVAVKVGKAEYFFAGEWLMGGAEDVLSEKPRKHRVKDQVCGNDYCELR